MPKFKPHGGGGGFTAFGELNTDNIVTGRFYQSINHAAPFAFITDGQGIFTGATANSPISFTAVNSYAISGIITSVPVSIGNPSWVLYHAPFQIFKSPTSGNNAALSFYNNSSRPYSVSSPYLAVIITSTAAIPIFSDTENLAHTGFDGGYNTKFVDSEKALSWNPDHISTYSQVLGVIAKTASNKIPVVDPSVYTVSDWAIF